jgi:hypothetical protein
MRLLHLFTSFWSFGSLALKAFKTIWLSNLSTLRVPDGGYSESTWWRLFRNLSWALNLFSTFLFQNQSFFNCYLENVFTLRSIMRTTFCEFKLKWNGTEQDKDINRTFVSIVCLIWSNFQRKNNQIYIWMTKTQN